MSDIDDLKKHQVDHLILLVGGNPLPNAISGNLLVKSTGKITLIHSKAKPDEDPFAPNTEDVADRIRESFGSVMAERVKKKALMNPADRREIQSVVSEVLKDEKNSFGLNYTGGTKAMSVHAFRAVEDMAIRKRKGAVFSYLDSHSRKMMVDVAEYNPDMGTLKYQPNATPYKVGEFSLSLKEMLKLHYWETREEDKPQEEPILPKTSRALADINTHHWDVWKPWRTDFLKLRLGETILLPLEEELKPFCDAIQEELKFDTGVLHTEDLIAYRSFQGSDRSKSWNEVKQWLRAKWLESATLDVLQACALKHDLKDTFMSLKPYRVLPGRPNEGQPEFHFELDCAAVRGYQLFAISCTIDPNDNATEHWIEVCTRARQIGGDAARICLICNKDGDDQLLLRQKVLKSMDEGQNLLVLGKSDIAKLDEKIEEWINKCISYS